MVIESEGLTQFAPPLRLSEHEFSIHQTAPKVGEHNVAILQAAGYSLAEIEKLQASGTI